MKRCPECGREYDNSMMFCLDDGAELLYGPAAMDEPATAILHSTTASGEAATRAQIHTTAPTSAISDVTKKSFDKRLLMVPLALAVILFAGFFGYRYFSTAKQIESIAVMPFVNETGNPDTEYLSDGMTETLISSLSQVPNLSVKGRSSVFRYKGKETDARTIGKDLNVQAVLNGRVLQRGENLTLSLELIDTSTENVIWSDRYIRRSTDLVSLQSEIARDVSQKLKSKLTGADEQKIARSHTVNPEAYQLYLKGIYYWNKRTGDSIKKSIEYFNQAIEKDSSYALAHAGLALAYVLLPDYYAGTPEDSYPRAKNAALRALVIDGSLAEAHTVLGNVMDTEFNSAEAEREYQRAIHLNPNYATAYQWYGNSLLVQGKFAESIHELKRAQERDPLSLIIRENLGEAHVYAGQYDEGLKQGNELVEIDPSFFLGHRVVAFALQKKGMFPEALASYKRMQELNDDPNFYMGNVATLYAEWGKRDDVLRIMEETKQVAARRYVSPFTFAIIYSQLGAKDATLEHLEHSYQSRRPEFKYVAIDGAFKDLRSDPRFSALLQRTGFSK